MYPVPGKCATVAAKISGVDVVAQWDGASPYTVVGPQFLQSFRQQGIVVRPLTEAIKSAAGDKFPTLGWAVIRVKLPGKEFLHPVVVAENLAHSCLLGSDIMNLHGAVIIMKESQWFWLDAPSIRFQFHGAKDQEGVLLSTC